MNRSFVLLHGFTGSPSSWDEVVARLPRGARVLRPTLYGHGGERTLAPTSFECEVDRLAALVRAERLEKVHLVGYSLGGRIALGLLARHPRLFARATLVGASPGIDDSKARIERRALDESRAAALETDGLEAFVSHWEREPLFSTQAALPPSIRARHRAIRLGHSAAGLAASLRTLGLGAMPSLWNELKAITVPVRLVVGSEDLKFSAIALDMAARMPNAHVSIVPGVGHDVVLERPDVMAALIESEDEQ